MMEGLELSRVLEGVWSLVALANRYIEDSKPWALHKDENSRRRLDGVLFNLVFALLRTAEALDPFLPATAKGIREQIDPGRAGKAATPSAPGEEEMVPVGAAIGEFTPLFPLREEQK